jgi:diguanylate cyclase (GGDEF)-like protein
MTEERSPPADRTARSSWRNFLVALGLVILLSVSALFTGIAVSGQHAIDAEVETRARTLVRSIILARKWNALHGGVFVEKTPGTVSSPWLPGTDVTATNGKPYILKNPALMAREMATLAEQDEPFRFRITSLKPLNPANLPDAFEAEALRAFEEGVPEHMQRDVRNGSSSLRYMVPLHVEESCLACHAKQGYRVGDVRGGISVTLPTDAAEAGKARARAATFALFVATLFVMMAVVWRLVRELRRRLAVAEARIVELAITDELTGLRNRRHTVLRIDEELARARRSGRPFSLLLFDVDHFKRVNDQHGHAAGDAVLRGVAGMALRACRASDLVGRYGGEEFLVLLPETAGAGAEGIADRLRTWIEAMRTDHDETAISVTASFGVATFDPTTAGAAGAAELVKRADDALYRAKGSGRNRVVREA